MRAPIRSTLLALVLIAVATLSGGAGMGAAAPQIAAPSPDGVWRDVAESDITVQGERQIIPDTYRTLALDAAALQTVFAAAPMENPAGRTQSSTVLYLPMPGGDWTGFRIWEAPIMAPELAAKFPSIKTYAGQGEDDPSATVRIDLTPAGFHAMILTPTGKGTVFIDPYSRGDTTHYISYYTSEYSLPFSKEFTEIGVEQSAGEPATVPGKVMGPSGSTLRTYRLAMAATGEYTQFHGGTVELAMAAIVTSMNRDFNVRRLERLVAHVREHLDRDLDVGVVELALAGERDDDARDVRPRGKAIRESTCRKEKIKTRNLIKCIRFSALCVN